MGKNEGYDCSYDAKYDTKQHGMNLSIQNACLAATTSFCAVAFTVL
jgi:hypothetical protein